VTWRRLPERETERERKRLRPGEGYRTRLDQHSSPPQSLKHTYLYIYVYIYIHTYIHIINIYIIPAAPALKDVINIYLMNMYIYN
jgi:hypothetical protein